jgi:hypothetical protein
LDRPSGGGVQSGQNAASKNRNFSLADRDIFTSMEGKKTKLNFSVLTKDI